jgi:D-tyrosyl-tRNA(Tyr) deacylase
MAVIVSDFGTPVTSSKQEDLPMRAVVQRVLEASVSVDGKVVGAIDKPGLLVLLGVTHSDGPEEVAWMARKIWGLRILREEKSASDLDAPVLVVSQFTLYGDARKGRRPTWVAAAPGEVSEPVYEAFCAALRELGVEVTTGVFGARMEVELVNDGPVTIVLETSLGAGARVGPAVPRDAGWLRRRTQADRRA